MDATEHPESPPDNGPENPMVQVNIATLRRIREALDAIVSDPWLAAGGDIILIGTTYPTRDRLVRCHEAVKLLLGIAPEPVHVAGAASYGVARVWGDMVEAREDSR